MSDFESALQDTFARNEEIAQRREEAEAEMDRIRREEEAAREREAQARKDQHASLAAHLAALAKRLKESRPDAFIVRTGWTESGEEFIAKMTTRQMRPKRSLFVEVDHDDDEVLARWVSDVGTAVEIWRLQEITEEMLTSLVLQVADDAAWTGDRPPPFPPAEGQRESAEG